MCRWPEPATLQQLAAGRTRVFYIAGVLDAEQESTIARRGKHAFTRRVSATQSVPPPLRELGRRRAVDLEEETKTPTITWILASLALMRLQMSVYLGSGMKQI